MRNMVFLMLFLVLCPCLSFAQDTLIIQRATKAIILTGYTRSKTTITVSSEVSGKVIRVNYDVGQIIGEKPFFEIDPTFINFQIKSTNQAIKKLKIAQDRMGSTVSYLKKEFDRIDKLHKGDRATEVRRDAAKEELSQARFELRSVKLERAILETTSKELEERKRRHNIYAPRDWIVVQKIVEPGELASPNMAMAKVSDYQELVVPLSVSGEELASLKRLPPEFDAQLEGRSVSASIRWVNPEFNEKTRKLGIELILAHHEEEARGGLRFSLPLEIGTQGLFVPKPAIRNRYDNPRVTVKETGKTINVMILGESDGGVVITEDEQLSVGTELSVQPGTLP